MKVKIIASLSAAILIAFTVISVLPVNGEEKIYTDLIRLHVIANSDSEDDQKLKLKVRDAILESAATLGLNGGKANAQMLIADGKSTLLRAANRIIEKEGYDYPVRI